MWQTLHSARIKLTSDEQKYQHARYPAKERKGRRKVEDARANDRRYDVARGCECVSGALDEHFVGDIGSGQAGVEHAMDELCV